MLDCTLYVLFVFEFIRARLDQWLLFTVDDVVTSINIAILIILVVDGCHGRLSYCWTLDTVDTGTRRQWRPAMRRAS